jgi:hypothetical protein
MVAGQTLELIAYKLKHTSAERDATHRVQEEVDAEVGVVEKHKELLQTPQGGRSLLAPQREAHENVEAYDVTETIDYTLVMFT